MQNLDMPHVDFDSWQHSIDTVFCPMEVKMPTKGLAFEAELQNTVLDRIRLARIGSSSVDVYRRKNHIAAVSDAFYLFKFQLQGCGLVRQRGHEALLHPGDFVVCSTSDPYELHFPDTYRQAVLAVPQHIMAELFSGTDDHLGLRMGHEEPAHGLLSSFVGNLVTRISQLEQSTIQRLEANVLDLLVTSLEVAARSRVEDGEPTESLRAVKRLVALNLRNPHLGPDFIAQKLGITKRYLHMLFQKEGVTVCRYIQQQRLRACGRVLGSPQMQHVSLTDIAHQWGFSDASHFHRCFKAVFQLTPGQYRKRAMQA